MRIRSSYSTRILGLALVASTLFATSASAEAPGVTRTFAVFLAPGFELEDVDFKDGDSVLVKVENSNSSGVTFDFVDCNDPKLSNFDFDGTRWASQPAMFITKGEGRKSIGAFYWLLDEQTPVPPPVNSVALLGSDEVLFQEKVFVRTCVSGNCCGSVNDGKKSPTINRLETPVIVVMAEFSK